MALTYVKVRLSKPGARGRGVEEELLVDSGAIYTVVPARALRRIGIKGHATVGRAALIEARPAVSVTPRSPAPARQGGTRAARRFPFRAPTTPRSVHSARGHVPPC